MPDHWHAILLPEDGTSISDILMRIKIAAYRRLSKSRECPQPIWQSRFYDLILHLRPEFDQTLEYIHRSPAVKGWLQIPSIGSGPVQLGMPIEPVRSKWTMFVCH